MKHLKFFTLYCVCVAVLSACASIRSGSECYIEESYLSQYSSFGWIHTSPVIVYDDSQYISPLMAAELQEQVKRAFEQAGYEFSGSGDYTDFYVSIVVTTRQLVDETIYFPAHRYERGNSVTTRENIQTTGFVAVDVFDGETGEPRWRGWAERALLLDDRHDSRDAIEAIVRSILVEFPTRK